MYPSKLRLLVLIFMGLSACQPPESEKPAEMSPDEIAELKAEATALQDELYQMHQDMDMERMDETMAEGGLFMGTDPGEVFDREAYLELNASFSDDSAARELMTQLTWKVMERDVRLFDEGEHAVVTDLTQISFSLLPVRFSSIMERTDGTWKFIYMNNAFVMPNEMIAVVDSAIAR